MKQKLINKQECIPVRCVPAALYRTAGLCPGGVSVQGGLCPRWVSVGGGLIGGGSVHGDPSPMERQTPVKILACPKLRLRATTKKWYPVKPELSTI